MNEITINPLYLEIGGPALLIGLFLGALIAWLIARGSQQRLERQIKSQEALSSERDIAHEAANTRLAQAFSELGNQSLKSNSDTFLKLAEQHLNVQNERAKRELGDREKAVEALVKPISDALEASKKQITELEKTRSEAYGGIREQLQAMNSSQKSLQQETQNLVNALRRPRQCPAPTRGTRTLGRNYITTPG